MNANIYRLVFSRARGFLVAAAEHATSAGKSASGAVLLGGVMALGAAPALAQTLPTGAVVTQGQGSVSVNGANMVVRQDSARMVADWQSFSIGANNAVRFVQPSSSSVALNRVVGNDASSIFGSLSANGHVYLQNPNGVLFAPGAQVNVGSLVATSLNADLDAFKSGVLRLSGGATTSGAVRNEGSITTAPGGHAVLAAPQVANTGSIHTPGGTAALVAGNAINIDPTGSGLLSITIPVAALNAQLENAGTLTADGGAVRLQAAATDAALRTVMQVGGVVRARSIEQRGGEIVLSGGPSGVVRVSGTLDASGAAAGDKGGTVKVLGERVALVGQARVDASGDSGGGTVLVGGNYQGQGPEINAVDTYVGRQVVLDASARTSGDGGQVVVWADNSTRYTGSIVATGGAQRGNGGQAEVSGKQQLDFDGQVNLSAARGKAGDLLLDPANIEIDTVADVNGDNQTGDDLASGNLLFGDFPGATSRITAARVAQLLGSGNVNLEATSSISVFAQMDVAAGGPNSTLTLNSPDVLLAAPMTLNNSSLAITSSNIFIDDAIVSANTVTLRLDPLTFPSIGQTFPSGIRTNSLTIARNSNAIVNVAMDGSLNQFPLLDITANTALVRVDNPAGTRVEVRGNVAGSFTLQTNTGITQNTTLLAGALAVSGPFTITTTDPGPVSGAVTLTHPSNNFTGSVFFNVGAGIELVTQGSLSASGSADRGVRLVAAGGPFTLNGNITSRSVANPSNIDLSGVGFREFSDDSEPLTLQTGGRFFIRSSDFSVDDLGALTFSAAGPLDINYTVLSGWTGADPTSGNGYYTNQTGQISSPGGDTPAVSKVYDGTTAFAFVKTGTNAQATIGSQIEQLTSYTITSSGNFADKNVGTGKAYSVFATNNVVATRSPTGDTFYGLQFPVFIRPAGSNVPASEITARAITSSGITGIDRVYNGTTTVAVAAGSAVLNGTIVGDSVALNAAGASGTMANKNVGIDKPITVSGLALSGTDAGNYSLTDASNATVDISALGITSSGITAINRVYDGTSAVALNTSGAALNGAISGDSVSLVTSAATGSMANKNVGTNKPVSVSGLSLTGADAFNYTIADASNAVVDISARSITSTGVTGVDRVYNGTTTVAVSAGSAVLNGAISGDSVSLVTSGATGTMADKNVGIDKPVSVSGLTLAGADASNYSLSDASNANVDITALGLTATGITALDRVYNGTTSVGLVTSAASLNGAISGDSVSLVTSGAAGTMSNKNVGIDKPVAVSGLALAGADALNYSVADASNALVDISALGITSSGITAVNRVYDGTTAVALNTGSATLSGTISGDSVSLATSGALGTMSDKNVGTNKPVAVGGLALAGADATNYTLTDTSNASVDISARGITSSGIVAIDRVYDATTVVALDTSGAVLNNTIAGDGISLVTSGVFGNMSNKTAGANKPVTISGLALAGADAPNYSLADASNASVDIATLTLIPAGITALNRVENGGTTVALNTANASVVGVLAGDVVGLDTSAAVGTIPDPNPGVNKPVTLTGLALTGIDAVNYAISSLPGAGNTTVTIISGAQNTFEELRYKEYLQGVSDAQEPFRRAMAEALAAGFGKENIRKQLQRGLVFETGLAPPAVDVIDSAARPVTCTVGRDAHGATLVCTQ